MLEEIYKFIKYCVLNEEREFHLKMQNGNYFHLNIYQHFLNKNTYDYWMETNNFDRKYHLSCKCDSKEELIENIYNFFIEKYIMNKSSTIEAEIKIDYLNNKIKELEKQLSDEKIAHTKTAARIVFAQHILSGNREDKVKDFWNNNLEYVNEYNR